MSDEQLIYDKMDRIFKGFVESNRSVFEEINHRGFLDVRKLDKEGRLYSNNMTKDPYNVAYIGLAAYGEGSLIAFLDNEFNKIYHYYDVM